VRLKIILNKKMVKLTKTQLFILIIDILYLLIFGILFWKRGNVEFFVYVISIILLLVFVGLLHLKFNFSNFVLGGLSFVGLLHMIGGGVIVNGLIMYGHYLVLGIIRYDKIVHFFGIFFAVFLIYEMIKSKRVSKLVLSLILILSGIGIGTLHELLEYSLVVILPETGVGGYENTMGDILFNAIGAVVAVGWLNFRRKKI